MNVLKSQYYDKPEGQDAFGKMIATNRLAMHAGLVWSTYDVLFITKPQGYIKTIGRYAYFTGPFMGMASAFTMATYSATRLRGKDDMWNYILGGIASSGVFGAWRKSFVLGCTAAVYLSIAAAVKKLSIIEGWEFFPDYDMHGYGSLRHVRYDWSMMKDPKALTDGKD